MINFQITVEGEQQFNRSFNRVTKHIEDVTPVWKPVQTEFFDIEAEQFDSEGAKGASGRWKPLSPKYEEIKLKKYGSMALIGGILYATGDLRSSLTRKSAHTVGNFGKQEAELGTDLRYAGYHQRGGGRLPKRKVIDLSDAQKTRLHKVIQKELLKLIRSDDEVRKTLVVNESNFTDI